LQFHSFDEVYLERLRARDPGTEQHFVSYFSALIQIKLRTRFFSQEAIEDNQQETFVRFFAALEKGTIKDPERLGSFVNSICNNLLNEGYRGKGRETSLDDDDDNAKELPGKDVDALSALQSEEMQQTVRKILRDISARDRRLLRLVFLEERDKDIVCKDLGVDRDYLRVLLLRARREFKKAYLKNNLPPPGI
jgi:RNA polymerase sigma-70 factor (ECF subfamily)